MSVRALVLGAVLGTLIIVRQLRWAIREQVPTPQGGRRARWIPWKLTATAGGVLGRRGHNVHPVLRRSRPSLIRRSSSSSRLSGTVVCAISYLLSEFSLRPIAARSSPRTHGRPVDVGGRCARGRSSRGPWGRAYRSSGCSSSPGSDSSVTRPPRPTSSSASPSSSGSRCSRSAADRPEHHPRDRAGAQRRVGDDEGQQGRHRRLRRHLRRHRTRRAAGRFQTRWSRACASGNDCRTCSVGTWAATVAEAALSSDPELGGTERPSRWCSST